MEKEKIFIEEERKLKQVIDFINEKIEEADKNFSLQQHNIIGFKEGMRGTQFTRQVLMSTYATEAANLRMIVDNPYFGKMEFKEFGKNSPVPIYIGKRVIIDDQQQVIAYDWRSSIASMYYDYSLGSAQYTSADRIVRGVLLSKRQLQIEKGKLIRVEEQDTLTDDKILLKYLNDNADSRLKSIVATIQKDQNQIIRSPLNKNYIVQGVAGSGKTTVLLHRIAYLLYNDAKNTKESDFMILGPNKYFLNYISGLLPELDIQNVSQSTFEEIALKNIGSKIKLQTQNETLQNVLLGKEDIEIINYKSSLEYLDLLKKYIEFYISSHLDKTVTYEGIEIINGERFKNLMSVYALSEQGYFNKINKTLKTIIKITKDNTTDLSHKIWARYRNEFLSLSKNHPRRKELLDMINKIETDLKSGCEKLLKSEFSFVNTSALNIYISFIECLDDTQINNKAISAEKLKEATLSKLKKKKISSEDLAPLLLIQHLLKGVNTYQDYKHLAIDEAQDLSIAQYGVLKLLFPKAIFDVYGDLNQSIYMYQGIDNWSVINDNIFDSRCNILSLNKGYRTTEQISNVSNYVLEQLNSDNAECVARKGNEIEFNHTDNSLNDVLIKIQELLDKGYKTIAIICKDSIETDKIYKQLIKLGLNIHKISEEDQTYDGGLCIMPSYLSKGLEFDAVIINDASETIYRSDSAIDMKLLYVSVTRALHELHINYSNELTKPLLNMNKGIILKKVKKK